VGRGVVVFSTILLLFVFFLPAAVIARDSNQTLQEQLTELKSIVDSFASSPVRFLIPPHNPSSSRTVRSLIKIRIPILKGRSPEATQERQFIFMVRKLENLVSYCVSSKLPISVEGGRVFYEEFSRFFRIASEEGRIPLTDDAKIRLGNLIFSYYNLSRYAITKDNPYSTQYEDRKKVEEKLTKANDSFARFLKKILRGQKPHDGAAPFLESLRRHTVISGRNSEKDANTLDDQNDFLEIFAGGGRVLQIPKFLVSQVSRRIKINLWDYAKDLRPNREGRLWKLIERSLPPGFWIEISDSRRLQRIIRFYSFSMKFPDISQFEKVDAWESYRKTRHLTALTKDDHLEKAEDIQPILQKRSPKLCTDYLARMNWREKRFVAQRNREIRDAQIRMKQQAAPMVVQDSRNRGFKIECSTCDNSSCHQIQR